jgi:hypothetical protein
MDADGQWPDKRLAVLGTILSVAGMILRLAAIRRKDRPLSPAVMVMLLFNYAVTWLLVVLVQAFIGMPMALLWAMIRHLWRGLKRPPESYDVT